jgi:hypothetical protein
MDNKTEIEEKLHKNLLEIDQNQQTIKSSLLPAATGLDTR